MSVANLFECTVAYEKMMENGMQKKVSEPYIVKAYSFTEAEAVITDFIKPYITGEFSIKSIKRCKCNEIVEDANGDRYFNAIISMITLDEKSGKEKLFHVLDNGLVGPRGGGRFRRFAQPQEGLWG